ncbi:MAG: hypothetical protein JWM72_1435 [Actinomycetia bacterium]|nr:hypothetical protein [Actinomycetes bacterium]
MLEPAACERHQRRGGDQCRRPLRSFHTTANNLANNDGNSAFDVYVRAVSMPTIESIAPNFAAPGASTTLTVTGKGFLPGSEARVTEGGMTVDSVTVISETELEATVTFDSDAASGGRTLVVWTPGTGPGPDAVTHAVCGDCLSVT